MSTERVKGDLSWSHEGWHINTTCDVDEMRCLRESIEIDLHQAGAKGRSIVTFNITMTVDGFRSLLEKLT